MKKIAFSLLCLFLMLGNMQGQSNLPDGVRGECGTHDHTEIFERLEANKKYVANHEKSAEVKYLPIKFHRVGETNGSMRIKISSILDMMARLKREFLPADIVPYFYELFNEIDNNGIFYDPPGNSNQVVSNKDPDAVNIFITENADVGSGGGGTTLGYYQPGGDFIIVRKKRK